MEPSNPYLNTERKPNGFSHYEPGEFSELRRRIVHKRNNEKAAAILMGNLAKHSVIVRKGRSFLIIISLLTLIADMYLMHMESVNRHLKSSVHKTMAK
jgi:hypothetical protein